MNTTNRIWDYKSTETQNLEYEKLYKRFWHFGAHKSELANNKDYVIFKIYDFEVVLYNDSGNIICFYNVCPHRGARLMSDDYDCLTKGNGNILCKYHHWGFSNNKLHIPNKDEFSHCKDIDLFRLKTTYCGDFVFFSHNPQMDLQAQLGDFYNEIQTISHSINQCININDKTKFKSNWKIGIENSAEPYHLNAVHPNSLAPLNMQSTHIFCDMNSKVSGSIANEKYYKKLKRNKDLFNLSNYYEEAYFSYYLFPFIILSSTFGYSYSVQTFFPNTPQNTHFTCRSYGVHSDLNIDAWNEGVIKMNKQIFDEDSIPTKLVQDASLLSDMQLVYAKNEENRILHFHKNYNHYMGL